MRFPTFLAAAMTAMLAGPLGAAAVPHPAPLAALAARPQAAPVISAFSPSYGVPGTSVTLTGDHLTGVTAVTLHGLSAAFTVVSATSLTLTVPAGATTGPIEVASPDGTAATASDFTVMNNAPGACTGIFLPDRVVTDVPVSVTGVNGTLDGSAALTSVDVIIYHTYDSDIRLSLISPAGQEVVLSNRNGGSAHGYGNSANCPNEYTHFTDAASTSIVGGTPIYIGSFKPQEPLAGFNQGSPNGTWTFRSDDQAGGDSGYLVYLKLNFSAPSPDLTVSTAQTVPAGTYHNLTVTGTGVARLGGPVTVENALLVQTGGTLYTACQPLTGPGSFTLEAGATLGICDAAGLSSTPGTGAVQVTGIRSYSTAASYVYNGTVTQQTGLGAPYEMLNLTVDNPAGLALSRNLFLRQVLRLTNGNLASDDHLTLLSDPTGTAMVVNVNGVVTGNATVRRYVEDSRNAGPGYRHFSSPVSGARVSDLRGYGQPAPTVNPAYNSLANPYTASPFPTVFTYDEQRLTAASALTGGFDYGWQSPALSDALLAGQGYSVNLAPTTLGFTGTLHTGPYPVGLFGGPTASSGWALVGNPYPAPIDWNNLPRPTAMDDALYVYRSDTQYGGSYVGYVNGQGPAGANLVASGQGFFVRLTPGQSPTTLTFNDVARVTSYASPAQYRTTAETRPTLELALSAAAGPADVLYVYQEAGATTGFDARYDAVKLALNAGSRPTLYQQAGSQSLSIQGLPATSQPLALPLGVAAPTAGTFTFAAQRLLNFPATTALYLEDKQTGTWYDLRSTTPYPVTLPQGLSTQRFVLHLNQAQPLATTPGSQPFAEMQVYPNPAAAGPTAVEVVVSGQASALQQARVELLNPLGQRVYQAAAPAAAGRTTLQLSLPTATLAAGFYTVRLTTATGVLTRKLQLL